jgi:signal transduction histidine kinase
MIRRSVRAPADTVTPVGRSERETEILRRELRECRRECRDIARDIHDGPFHEMTGLTLAMAAAQSGGATLEEYAARCKDSWWRLEAALGELRRAIHRLERCAGGGAGAS